MEKIVINQAKRFGKNWKEIFLKIRNATEGTGAVADSVQKIINLLQNF
ncbi:hypothetical protein [Bartonella sp. CDC_skunk]|nr:hypothetical protein [Bartonella sp. CDC_skunk]